MNSNLTFRPGEREFAIQLRSLLLKCVDILERQYLLGKYKGGREITIGSMDSVASPVAVREMHDLGKEG